GCFADGLRRLLAFGQTHLERLKNVDHWRFVRGSSGLNNLLTFNLGLDHGHEVFAIVVFVFARLKRRQQGFNQHLRQRQLFVLDFAGIGAKFLHLANFIFEIHGVQEYAASAGPQNDDVLAIVHGNLGYAHAAALAQGFKQQGIGFLAGFVRREIVGSVKENGIDFRGLDELEDFHGLGRLRRDFLNFLVVDDYVLVFFVLVAFYNIAALDRRVLKLAIERLLHA